MTNQPEHQLTVMTPIIRDPIYQQLNRILRQLIGSEFKIGDKFLTEREIGERFSVSRVTANKALSNLVSEGLLAFRKGVGTFVQGTVLDLDLRALVSFTEKSRAAGKQPSTAVARFDTLPAHTAGADIPERLGCAADDTVYYMERVRCANDVPVILERRHVLARHCPGLSKSDVAGSLYSLWTEKFGLEIGGANERIRAVNIGGADAKRLQVRPQTAGLLVISTGFLSGNKPLWYEHTLYRGDAYEFTNTLGRVHNGGPAMGRMIE